MKLSDLQQSVLAEALKRGGKLTLPAAIQTLRPTADPNVAEASLSRCFSRLAKRGLGRHDPGVIELTAAGKEAAGSLEVRSNYDLARDLRVLRRAVEPHAARPSTRFMVDAQEALERVVELLGENGE